MSTYSILSFIRRYILWVFAFLVLFLFQTNPIVSPSHPFVDDNNNGIDDFEEETGQYVDPEIRAKIYGVNFPIAELGNCGTYYECRSFCEDPVNFSACIDYAKQRGFYKEEEVDIKKKEGILEKAQTELGCDSYETCKSLCQIPTNFEKCDAFASKQGIAGGHVADPKKKEVLEKAKEVLGCDSYSSCAAYCSDDTNRQKCSEFAKESGLRGGERPIGPGGCTSEGSCKTFCSDPQNFQVCKGFVSSAGGKFQGPGGCDSEESCKTYCTKNPQNCGFRNEGELGLPVKYDPQEMCNRTPACSWKNNTCQCGFYNDEETKKRAEEAAKYCRENPTKCTPGGIREDSKEDKLAFEKFCRENPQKCRPVNDNPMLECIKYSGCSWSGNSCQCSTRIDPNQGEINPEKSCTSGGCKWTGNSCDCSSSPNNSPALRCGMQPGCSWINSNCQCYSPGSPSMPRPDYPNPTYYPGQTNYPYATTYPRATYYPQSTYYPTATYQPSATYQPTTINPPTTSTGMSRDQQEAGCRSCGGTCNWSGDFCNCQCAGSGSSGGGATPAPAPVQTQAPQPEQQSQPASQPEQQNTTQTSGGSSGGGSCPDGSYMKDGACVQGVQGVSTMRGLFERLLDFFR